MRRPIKSSVCALSLAVGAFFLTGRISCGQTAAEYRTRTEAAKQWPREAVRGAKAMVATDEELGSKAGVEILKSGGNAVDAAVAVAFALAVVEPAAGNIGGGGFMLVRLADGRTTFLDYREVAPDKATRDMYIKDGKLDEEASVISHRAVADDGSLLIQLAVLDVHVAGSFVGGDLAIVEEGSAAIGQAHQHESATADIAGRRLDNREREGHRDCRIHGIAPAFEDFDAGFGAELLVGGNHRVGAADGLLGPVPGRFGTGAILGGRLGQRARWSHERRQGDQRQDILCSVLFHRKPKTVRDKPTSVKTSEVVEEPGHIVSPWRN